MTTTLSLCLELGMVLLICSSLVEVGLLSTTLGWLRGPASAGFHFYDGVSPESDMYTLAGAPAHLLVTQVYVALADAGGAAFLLAGAGGFLALWARRRHLRLYHRQSYHLRHASSRTSRALLHGYYAWVGAQLPLLLFTAAALGYVYNVTAARQGQAIRIEAAVRASSSSPAGGAADPYPLDTWTPQSWFLAVLNLDLVESRGDVRGAVSIMDGWFWNLCPMLAIQLVVAILAMLELVQWRRARQTRTNHEIKRLSRV